MKSSRRSMITALLVAAGSIAFWRPAHASEDPIPGVDVVVEKIPPGNAVGRTTTDRRGMIRFDHLDAGYYEVRSPDNTMRAGIRHAGGPAQWQLLQRIDAHVPTWSLMNAARGAAGRS